MYRIDRINWTFLFLFQHAVLALKFAVAYAIPDIPEWVETEIAKVEFQRRQALKVMRMLMCITKTDPTLRTERLN